MPSVFRAATFLAPLLLAAAQTVTINAPPAGSVADVTGTALGLPEGEYKAVLLVSQNQNEWYDKTHGPGVPLTASGGFTFTDWAWDPVGDAQVPYFGVWVVPADHDMTGFECEGIPVPASLVNAAVATGVVNRNGAQPPAQGSVSRTPAPAGTSTTSGAGMASLSAAAAAVVLLQAVFA